MDQEPDKNQTEEPASLETPRAPAEPLKEEKTGQNTATPEQNSSPEKFSSELEQPSEKVQALPPKKSLVSRLLGKIKSINIYLLLFTLLIVLATVITFVAYQKTRQSAQDDSAVSQNIDEAVLDQLRNTDVSIGDPKQILSVEANAVFAGSVLIRGDLESASQIKSQGRISTPAINVSGTGTFQTLQTNRLQITGDSQIQGNLNVQNTLSVSGSGNFGGTLSANKLNTRSLELSGNLVISRHVETSGGTPGKSNGSALGGGGTASISGSDTAGTVAVNTGSNPKSGCFISVSFTQGFNSTPHVVISPVGSSGGSIDYYINRSSSGFSICSASTPPAGRNFAFDYIVID
ncbi:MAG TPA: hypothetical protein VFX86_00365 [Candidatus Saccharimonadales bacterium]|nr:hypothetical protein [Candidatus Saccharimonadales bacterium]